MRMRLPRTLRILAIGVASLAALGLVYQPIATAIDAHRFPAPGRLIDMGGYHLHIDCEGLGGPTIVLEAGVGGSSLDWSLVRSDLAKETRVCVYDRAGYGWSEPGPMPRTSAQAAEELHTLLIRAGEPGPYLLAAQGMGGLHAQVFAATYPRETAGLVLIDPPSDTTGLQSAGTKPVAYDRAARVDQVVAWLARLSVHRVPAVADALPAVPGDIAEKLPEAFRPAYRAVTSTSRYFDTLAAETAALPESQRQAGAAVLPPDLPLYLLLPDSAPSGPTHLDHPKAVLDAIRTVRDRARRGARSH